MAEFAVRVSREAGCLDNLVGRLGKEQVQIESLACACSGVEEAVASFSVVEPERLSGLEDIGGRRAESSVLHVKVPNTAGCLARVTTPLSEAGVNISSLSCACASGDESGIVAVGLARK
jgi:acetolactate synthase small subunit